jgi:tetratricopeptide (TPR) repeat protein
MSTATRFIEALNAERARERAFVEALPDSERSRIGTFERWSAKDLMAHITAWKRQAVLRLTGDPSALPEQSNEDVESANTEFWRAFSERPWEPILADADATHAGLLAALQPLSDAELAAEDRFPWQSGTPLWRHLAGTLLMHPFMHLAEHAIEMGQSEAAVAEVEAMLESLEPVSDLPSWVGVLRYNSACIFARAGRTDDAFRLLEQALRDRPDLVDWSKQDSDLDSLRGLPRMEQLYADLES